MKILVFDDSVKNQESARMSLVDHDLTVVGTYDEAQKALTPQFAGDETRQQILSGLLAEAGMPIDFDPYKKDKGAPEGYWELVDRSYKEAVIHQSFDVVMTDLMVPASRQAQGDEGTKFVGQEMPLGTIIALLALAVGVRNVAVVTDMNHHHHPASAAFDCFRDLDEKSKQGSPINIICTNSVNSLRIDTVTGQVVSNEFLESDAGKEKYPYPEGKTWGDRKGIEWGGKNWGTILKKLVG